MAGAGVGAYLYFFQTYHFAIVQENIFYRDGMQGMRRFRNAYRLHPFKCVINLQSDDDIATKYREQVAEEQEFCKTNGINWRHIPMKQETPPTQQEIAEFLKIAGDSANQPVFVHDSQGVIREGMMVAVWQMERMGYDPARTEHEVRWFGHPPKEI